MSSLFMTKLVLFYLDLIFIEMNQGVSNLKTAIKRLKTNFKQEKRTFQIVK